MNTWWKVATVAVVLVLVGCEPLLDPKTSDPPPPAPPPPEVTYNLTYHPNGALAGQAPAGGAFEADDLVTVAANPGALSKGDLVFVGWNTREDGTGTHYNAGSQLSMGEADRVLYARWTSQPVYSITYVMGTAESGSVPTAPHSYLGGTSVTAPGNPGHLAKEDETFVGWLRYLDGGGADGYSPGETFTMPAQNIELHPTFTEGATYRVTYHGNGATAGSAPVDETDYPQSAQVTVRGNSGDFYRAGYTFAGWNTAADQSGTTYGPGTWFYMPSQPVNLYAVWTSEATFQVVYRDNGAEQGAVPVDFSRYATGGTARILGNVNLLTKDGLQVAGWNTEPDGSGVSYAVGASYEFETPGDLTLYAIWLDERFVVGGTGTTVAIKGVHSPLPAQVTVAEGITTIDNYALKGQTSLVMIELPRSLTSIYSGAFEGCTSLTTFELPAGLTFLSTTAFQGCPQIASLPVNPENALFQSVEGVVFQKNTGTLHLFPPGKGGAYTVPATLPLSNVTITRVGTDAFRDNSLITAVTVPNSVTELGYSAFQNATSLNSVVLPATMTTWGHYVFSGCTALTSISIPRDLTGVPPRAFRNCTSLTTVQFAPQTVLRYLEEESFAGCTDLQNLTLPASVTQLTHSVFKNCVSLTSMTIPATVLSVGGWTFQNCTSLQSAVIQAPLSSLPTQTFDGCVQLASVSLPNGITAIGPSAFRGCTSLTAIPALPTSVTKFYSSAFRGSGLTSIDVPSHVTSIESGAFAECTSLTTATLQATVQLGDNAFLGCSALASVSLPNTLNSLGASAFKDCTLLAAIDLPDSLLYLDDRTFAGCTALTSVTLPPALRSLGIAAFADCTQLASLSLPGTVTNLGTEALARTGLTTITLPASVTTLGGSVLAGNSALTTADLGSLAITTLPYATFSQNTSLTTVTLPPQLRVLAQSTFQGCESLVSIALPTTVTTIGLSTFEECTNLTSLTLPASVTSVGSFAFAFCPALSILTCLAPSPPTFSVWSTEEDLTGIQSIRVPVGSVTLYQAASGWSEFADKIEAL